MIVSRFYVSGVNTVDDLKSLYEITKDFFQGCTIIRAVGYWENVRENCYIIEVGGGPSPEKLKEYARCLATQFDQDCVMLIQFDATVLFLSPD